MKQAMITFKEFWQNKRYRSILILGLYVVFFLIVIIGFRSLESSKPKPKPVLSLLEQYKTVERYQYQLLLKDDILIEGTVQKNEQLIATKTDHYYIKGNQYYQKQEEQYQSIEKIPQDLTLELVQMTPVLIGSYIEKGTKQYRTEYQSSVVTSYTIPLELLSFKESTWIEVNFKTVEENNHISEIQFEIKTEQETKELRLIYDLIGQTSPIDPITNKS